ncbi:MAG: hypothetical protein C0391_02835 [Anaerolinea sp.]|nr:hypothetical protein [Anaerolinea sp.]
MQHHTQLSDVQLGKTWLTIGSFDGVHIGHQYLINQMVNGAHANGAGTAVLTFHPHPAVVLRGKQDSFYLTGQEEKRELLEDLGVDICISMEFNLTVASYTAQFFLEMLSHQMELRKLVVGQGFALGRGRTGDIPMLEHIGAEQGFDVDVIRPAQTGNLIASSSQVRQLLSDRDVEKAAEMLGRRYSLPGIVTHGDGRGRGLGFPTANIATSKMRLLPGSGVYACIVTSEEKKYKAVANIGVRPTFNLPDKTTHLEVHLLDFDREIFGELITVEFAHFLRNEIKFASASQLTAQIQMDIQSAREIL